MSNSLRWPTKTNARNGPNGWLFPIVWCQHISTLDIRHPLCCFTGVHFSSNLGSSFEPRCPEKRWLFACLAPCGQSQHVVYFHCIPINYMYMKCIICKDLQKNTYVYMQLYIYSDYLFMGVPVHISLYICAYICIYTLILYIQYIHINISRNITYYISCAYGITPLRTGKILPTLRHTTWYDMILWLVVDLKNMSSSVGIIIPNWMDSHKKSCSSQDYIILHNTTCWVITHIPAAPFLTKSGSQWLLLFRGTFGLMGLNSILFPTSWSRKMSGEGDSRWLMF